MKRLALLLAPLLLALPLPAQCGDGQAQKTNCEAGCSTTCTGEMTITRAGEIVDRIRKPGCANIARHGLQNDLECVTDRDEAQHLVARLREAKDRDAAIALVMKRATQDEKAQASCGGASCNDAECSGAMTVARAGVIVDRIRTNGCANIARHGLQNDLECITDKDEAQHFVARLREAADRDSAIALVMKRAGQDEKDGFDTEAARDLARRVRAPGCSSGGRNFIFQEMNAINDIDVAARLAASVREAGDLESAAVLLVKASGPVRSMQDQDEGPTAKSSPLTPVGAMDLAKRVRAPGCSSGGSNLLFQEIDSVTEIEEAEILAARVREARDLQAAAAEILFAAMRKPAPKLPETLPATLADTGFFADLESRTMAKGFVPYEVNVPLWSDGAKKARFFRLPQGQKAEFTKTGEWSFPDGTTFLQTLYFPKTEEDDELRIETRVMVKRGQNPLFGVYVWNDDVDDGDLTENGDEFFANHGSQSQLWKVGRVKDCTKCHNEAAGLILGLNTAQLNKSLETTPAKHQIRELAAAGHVANVPEDMSALPALANPHDTTQPLEERARAYLHVHCATCHQPGGPGSGTMDLREQTEFLATGIVRSPTHRLRRGQVRPGRPEHSRLIGRMASVDWDRMPDLLTTVPDDKAIEMLSEWVRSMKRKPTTVRK